MQQQEQPQIPFGNDKQKSKNNGNGKCNSKCNSRSPAGMTARKATAMVMARASVGVDLRFGGMMGGIKRGLMLVGLLIAIAAGGLSAVAQLATTTVADTVYRADGTTAGGSVVVSWGSFTTANGNAVTAGTTTVTIGSAGAFSIALAPNAVSTPMGSYYTAVFHLNDGTTKREYWSVPVTVAGGGPVTLAGISTQVLPASVAM